MYKNVLRQIANTLYVNAQLIEQYGLLTGKLGITLFFYHYHRFTGNNIYSEIADEYIDNLFDNIERIHAKDFVDGLAGIGWGIETLIKNNFVEADDDILIEVDTEIAKMNTSDSSGEITHNLPLFSKGLYFTKRQNKELVIESLTQCKEFLYKSMHDGCIIPPSYIQSIIYCLNKAKDMGINIDMGNLIIENIDYKPSIDVMEQGWQNLVYQYNTEKKTELTPSYLQDILREQLQNPDSNDLALYKGLAGIGLELIRLSY